MDYEKWHDGIGYQTDLLPQMDATQRAEIEALLLSRLDCPSADWRDIEALDVLNTPAARLAIHAALNHKNLEVANAAAAIAMRDRGPAAAEGDILRSIAAAEAMNGLDAALRLACECNTPRVRAAVLERCRSAEGTVRVNMAAALYFMCGKAAERFDWNHRPFFLRFASAAERHDAWMELRQVVAEYENTGGRR